MRYFLTLVCVLSGLSGWPGPAYAHAEDIVAVPSPDCIRIILNEDRAVPAEDCLRRIGEFESRDGRDHDGAAYPIADLDADKLQMRIHYTGGAFPDAALPNWPISIELNFGGSGWFSYLLVLVETRAGKIASGFVKPAGDRCNDGNARWDRFSENGNGIYMRSATPFRLVNPLDETSWRAVENAMLFEGKDDAVKRDEMLALADPPLYRSWLPYEDLTNCAACCAGEIVVMQSLIGAEIDPGRDYAVLGVILYPQRIAELASSEKIGDRCLAAGLGQAAARAEPSGADRQALFLYRDSWIELRDGLAADCAD